MSVERPSGPKTPTTGNDRPTAHAATLAHTPLSTAPTIARTPSSDAETLAIGEVDSMGFAETEAGGHVVAIRYQERELLGAGGMGEVKLTFDRWIGREVARKEMKPEVARSALLRSRFLREVRVQGQLEHPAVVPVYDFGFEDDGTPFFTMRRVRGQTLAEVLSSDARTRFSRRKLLTALSTVCMVVHYAHARGVLHLDLKPQNVMLGDFGEVYVLDWGIARLRTGGSIDGGAPSSRDRAALGTAGYASPEQIEGAEEVGPAADVYAIGAMLFEVLAGERLFDGEDVSAVLDAQLRGDVVSPGTRAAHADVPPELDDLCLAALARRPEDRLSSAEELSKAIERYLDGDRDVERRRELAAQHTLEASELAKRAEQESDPERAQSVRDEATRVALQALALDPASTGAQGVLASLLGQMPRVLPAEAEHDRSAQRANGRAEAARLSFRAFASYLASIPILLLLGVKNVPVLAAGYGLSAVAAIWSARMSRQPKIERRNMLAIACLSIVVVVLQSGWLGPFVLVPTTAALTVAIISLYAEPHERQLVLGMSLVMGLAPMAIELSGLFPPSFAFQDGNIVLFPRATELNRLPVLLALAWISVGYVMLPAVFLMRVRDALRGAEDRVFFQAWQLRRMFKGRTTDGGSRSTPASLGCAPGGAPPVNTPEPPR